LNLNETKAILKDIALLDNRKLDEAVAMAWHAVIGHLNFDGDAVQDFIDNIA
jgi:hypothetical protein